MAIRIMDSIKTANDSTEFPVAYGEDIWLDKNKGSGTPNYDSIQNMYNNSELGGGGSSIQVDTMPVASADNVGKIFQYVGETGTYKKGHFYECIWNRYDTTVYEWKAVDHFRFNHPVYSLNCEPVNSDFIAGDIIYYTGASTDRFKENHFYRALPDATKRAYYQAGFWFTESQATVYYAPVPFELRIGFIFTTSDQYPKPYQLTAVNEDGITITPYGWSGEPITYIGVTFPTTVQGWEELEGGGGTSIFYGTMDEWNALTTDEKKKYDYMTDNDEGSSSIIRPKVMNISNSPVNEGEPFYTNVTNSLEVFKIVANAMYADIDTSRILTPYMGHATAYTTDESNNPNVGVSMYIATACWGANGHPYIRMRIFADNDKEYLFARSQDGVFNFAESSGLVDITPIKVNVSSNSGAWANRCGRVVNVNFAALVTLNQTTPPGTILYSGFPKPVLDIVRFGVIDAQTIDVVTGLVQINSAGNLVADGQGLKPDTAYWGSFTYLTNE